MQLGIIGLGRMGTNMTRRLTRGGHAFVVFDAGIQAIEAAGKDWAPGRFVEMIHDGIGYGIGGRVEETS